MCALFYDYHVALATHRHVACEWGETEPLLVAGLDNKEVHTFTDEGEKNPGSETYTRTADIVAMQWQPRGGALAIGWSDGMVSLWVPKENTSREVSSPHTGRVGLLKWAPTGNRLLSADDNGMLSVWKVDYRYQMSLATNYTRQGSLTQCVFATLTPSMEKKSRNRSISATKGPCPSFFFGGEMGSVHYADDLGHISDIHVLNHSIDAMLFYEERSRLIVITRALQMVIFQVEMASGTVQPILRVKLSVAGDGSLRDITWAGPGLLAIASGEPLLRLWDLQAEENNVLSLPKQSSGGLQATCLSFSPQRRLLAAGTAQGTVVFWKGTTVVSDEKENNRARLSHRWDTVFTIDIGQSCLHVKWSSLFSALSVSTTDGIVVLHEGTMQRKLSGDTAVIQSRPSSLSVERFRDGTITQTTLATSIRVKGLSHDGISLVIWNGSRGETYELRESGPRLASQFKCGSTSMEIRGDSIYRTNGNHVEVCNLQGVVKNTISFTEAEGKPSLLSIQGKFLAVVTDFALLRVFDLSRREPKVTGAMGNLHEYKEIKGMKKAVVSNMVVNADGTRIAFLIEKQEGQLRIRVPVNKLFVFQTDLNVFHSYDFGPDRTPLTVCFDPHEPRLMSCEVVRNEKDKMISKKDISDENASESSDKEIIIAFASNDHGIMLQDSFDLDVKYSVLLGIQVPRVYLIAQHEKDDGEAPSSYLRAKIMRDFVGFDKVDETARQALIDFCYYMTIGNMDEAYRSVKLIENPSVWENMAHMCVKTKRLDVAEVCLGNMGHARGAAAVQEAKKEPQIEVPVAMVAIQLGLLDDAARLYRECGRYDLLNKLYQASGYWQKATKIATKQDRVHLKTTYYELAQHYEEMGDLEGAITAYEDAGTHHKDVPRMLYKAGKMEMLQKYITTSKNRDLLIWWAQFQESKGNLDKAIETYERADDILSVVRVLCYKGEYKPAVKLVQSSGHRGAAYHLARQFELQEDVQSAIHFFAKGGCYNHAIRLAKEHHFDAELMSFAVRSKQSDMLECAAYFENRGDMAKAVQLYQRGGNLSKALDLCFQAQLFDELHHLTDELGSADASPVIVKKCAAFFVANLQYEKAVHMYLRLSRLVEALDICLEHNVKVTEEMAEQMTPAKDDKTVDKKRRVEVLQKLAKCCKQQGLYHLATKKYTQAGNKLKAMKCLLKSGDTEKVIFFANVSRNNEIFILAANYLQTLDWRQDAEILKHIVTFYSKAKATEQLAAFYDSCAQMEIEEYRNYAKATNAIKEAIKVITKSRGDGREKLLARYETKLSLMEQFVDARALWKQNRAEAVSVITKLLEEPDIADAIRIGDGYGMLVESAYANGDFSQCATLLQMMQRKGITIKAYVDTRVLRSVEEHMRGLNSAQEADGKTGSTSTGSEVKGAKGSDNDAEEEIDEDGEMEEDIEEED